MVRVSSRVPAQLRRLPLRGARQRRGERHLGPGRLRADHARRREGLPHGRRARRRDRARARAHHACARRAGAAPGEQVAGRLRRLRQGRRRPPWASRTSASRAGSPTCSPRPWARWAASRAATPTGRRSSSTPTARARCCSTTSSTTGTRCATSCWSLGHSEQAHGGDLARRARAARGDARAGAGAAGRLPRRDPASPTSVCCASTPCWAVRRRRPPGRRRRPRPRPHPIRRRARASRLAVPTASAPRAAPLPARRRVLVGVALGLILGGAGALVRGSAVVEKLELRAARPAHPAGQRRPRARRRHRDHAGERRRHRGRASATCRRVGPGRWR